MDLLQVHLVLPAHFHQGLFGTLWLFSTTRCVCLTMSLSFANPSTGLLNIRNINRIRPYIDVDTCHNLVRALVLWGLDYCKVLMNGICKKDLKRLQRNCKISVPNWFSSNPKLNMLHCCLSCIGCQSVKGLCTRLCCMYRRGSLPSAFKETA